MKKIFKYELALKDELFINEEFEIQMPIGAEILTVQQQGIGQIVAKSVIWAIVDADAAIEARKFWLLTTGVSFPDKPLDYVGTIQFQNGSFVAHLFTVV